MDLKRKGLPLIITVAATLVIVAVICAYAIIHNTTPPPAEETPAPLAEELKPKLAIAADKEGPAGIEGDSGFIIKSEEPVSAAELNKRLSLAPQTPFELTQRTPTELYLKPTEELRPGSVYNVLLAENSYEPALSWAFQTKSNFRLINAFPAAGGRYVPVNSGVELTFSQPVEGIGAYVSISPALKGRFEAFNDTTVVFIPGEEMQYSTTYTVTLSPSLPSTAGDVLGGEASFTFRTEDARNSNYYDFYPYDGLSETFTTTDPVYVRLYASEEFSAKEMQADVYRYPSLDAYLSAEKSHMQNENSSLPSDGLAKVSSFTSPLIVNYELFWRLAYLPLPENPGPGWYLVDIEAVSPGGLQGQRTQKLLQITDISVYTQTANNQMLLWLNDAAGGQALSGAQVTLEGQSAVSDADGVALFTVPAPTVAAQDDPNYYGNYGVQKKAVRVRQGERQYGAYLDLYGGVQTSWQQTYYAYAYTDRAAYQPDDTIRLWGLILPRLSDAPRPKEVTLEWTAGGLYPDGITLPVQADGTFMGELKLEKQASGWEYLRFSMDGKFLTNTSISILEYVKPVYTANLSVDKAYYRKDDVIKAQAEVTFYDGTPARGLEIGFSLDDYSYSNNGPSQRRDTDENGRCSARFNLPGSDSWQPRTNYINAQTLSAEDRTVYFDQRLMIFPSNYMVEADFNAQAEGFTFAVESRAIDFSAVESGEFTANWDTDLLRGHPAEITGEATLNKVEYIRKKTGEFYDFINKVTVEQYEYERKESVLLTFPVRTENGRFTSQLIPYPENERTYYYITLNCTTPDGQRLTQTSYTPGQRYYYWNAQRNLYQEYSFIQDIGARDEYAEEYYDGDYMYYGKWHTYRSLYEQAHISIVDQNNAQPTTGRLLYTVAGQKVHNYAVQKDMDFLLPFQPEYIPNVAVMGAYFDGKHIFTVDSTTLAYRFPDSALNIEVTPDKERYQPGGEVKLKLHVTDQQGRNVAAQYLVSVADEAVFAIREQEVKPLNSIYQQIYLDYQQYASYIQPYDTNSGAESGEGGGEEARREFADTVAFVSGQTDKNGQASITFKLADNITSWRITSIAFCEQTNNTANVPQVGKNISNIASGLPFFINQVLNGRYLAGEDIGLSLRGAGSAIKDQDQVSYQVTISGEDVNLRQSAEGPAGYYQLISFEPLPEGSYTVLIKASCGTYSDALELPIEVVESLLITQRRQSGDLSTGLNITARRFPVRLTLYDIDNTVYYDTLYSLLAASGNRADQIIARALAGQRLNALTDENYPEQLDITAEEAGSWRYGLRLFPYAQTDPLLTAKAVAAAAELLDGPALTTYFRDIIANKESELADVAAAYMGLAALREPVLLDLRKLLAEAQKNGFGFEDSLHLAIGLALLGDNSTAASWYEKNITANLKRDGNTVYYASGENEHYDYTISAEAAMLATLIKHEDHRGLLAYLTSHTSRTYAPLLELALYVNRFVPNPYSAATISYTLNGESISHRFSERKQLYLELGETQLAEANFTVESGNVGYTAYYSGGLEEAENTLPQGVSIKYNLSSEVPLGLGQTLTVATTVTFSGEAPAGVYHIAQTVPSGLRFTGVPGYSYQENWYYSVGEMGLIDFYIYPTGRLDSFGRATMPSSVTFSYQARAVLPGEYIMEADAISYSGSNTLYAGERRRVTVKE